MQLFRIGALVVFHGQVVPILNRWVHPDGAVYLLHTRDRDRGLRVHAHVTFGQLVAELNERARWCVGDRIEVGEHVRVVRARWWNARVGTVMYRINDTDDRVRGVVIAEEALAERLEDAHLRLAHAE